MDEGGKGEGRIKSGVGKIIFKKIIGGNAF